LHFAAPDFRRYPGLALALQAGRQGGTYPAAFAAADEVAVTQFLDGRLGFLEITQLLDDVLSAHKPASDGELEGVLAADAWGRDYATNWVTSRVSAEGATVRPVLS
jgi:1-deoxy-D-xylulose-5-phosphate reductoisomerase